MHARRIILPSIALLGGGGLLSLYFHKRPELRSRMRKADSARDALKEAQTGMQEDAANAAHAVMEKGAQSSANALRSTRALMRRTKRMDESA